MDWLKVNPGTQLKPEDAKKYIKDPVKFLYNLHDSKKQSNKKAFSSNSFAVARKSAKVTEILKEVNPKFGKLIVMLDYGCGDGTESLTIRDYLTSIGTEVKLIQCDIRDLRTLSSEEKKNITFIKSDEFDFRKYEINFAVVLNVLHHLESGHVLNSLETVIDGLQSIPYILIREHNVLADTQTASQKDKDNQAAIYLQHILYEVHEMDRMTFDEFRKFLENYQKKFTFIPSTDLRLLFIDHKIEIFKEKRFDFRYHAFLSK